MPPILSVIIPCYNHGHFIQEAIDSVLEYKGCEYEIIIVNDGSTDQATISKLAQLEAEGFRVISQQNSGIGCTRNTGIKAASGKYILPLDADNKIKPEYIHKALPLLESNAFDIVYAKPVFFGRSVSTDRQFVTRAFDILDLSMVNYVDACALYRKEVWEQVNGYDVCMPLAGNEDWEFWIHAYIKDFKFNFIDEELFYYRIENNSMVTFITGPEKGVLNQQYIFTKHKALFQKLLTGLYYTKKMRDYDMKHPFRTFIKYMYYTVFRRTETSSAL